MDDKLPFQLGITGGIGSGKSVFARIFSSMGIPVYESDAEARNLYSVPEIREQVIALLGSKSYSEDGRPDTSAIAAMIYKNPEIRVALNGIIHPAVAAHYQHWLKNQHKPFILKVAALLFEADIASGLDYTALVISPETLRKTRISRRDPQRGAAQIEAIMTAQWPDEKKIKLADFIVQNDEKHSLIDQAIALEKLVKNLISGKT